MILRVLHPDAVNDPYDTAQGDRIADAICQEAETVASDAGSDLLESPDQAHRDQLRDAVIAAATAALQSPGDTYRDPLGVTWRLEVSR